MKKTLLRLIPVLSILALPFTSCSKDPALGDIQATIDGYTVTFSVSAKDVDTYLWDFGDNTTSTEAAPVHTYLMSGTYTVNLTVSGSAGESKTSKQIELLPSVTELLTGGPNAANGKTWVLSSAYISGVNGAGAIDNSMLVILPSVENMVTAIGLDGEYDNEYTFYADGRYSVDVKNGIALTAGLYGASIGNIVNYGNTENNLSIYGGTYTAPESSTWTIHHEDLVVDACSNPLGTEVPALHGNVTLAGKNWISLSDGAFFGILDYPSTRKFIIREITAEKMHVALFVCGYYADPDAWSIPAYFFHVTFVPKK